MARALLDGKAFAADKCGEQAISVKGESIDAWYSGKAHRHGGNIQVLLAPGGFPRRPWPGSRPPRTCAQSLLS